MKETILSKKLQRNLKDTFFQRIESGGIGLGIPDIFFQDKKINGWIELKQINLTKDIIRIPFRPGQLSWMHNYLLYDGNMFLLCSIKSHINKVILFKNKNIKSFYKLKDFFLYKNFFGNINNITIQDFMK